MVVNSVADPEDIGNALAQYVKKLVSENANMRKSGVRLVAPLGRIAFVVTGGAKPIVKIK